MSEHGDDPHNRTGIATASRRSARMLAGAAEFAPPESGDEREIARERVSSSKESKPLGSTPPPRRLDGVQRDPSLDADGRCAQLLDRLGERLGFERTSVRVYEALLAKFDAHDHALAPCDDGHAPTRGELESNLRDEFDHYRALEEAVAQLGGDPTALTPSADLQATMSKGLLEVLIDPRTSFPQCLEAVLVAELIDNEAWAIVMALTEQAGQLTIAARFRRALATEAEHLCKLRRWLAHAQGHPLE